MLLDVAVAQVLVVLLAGVFHHLPIGPEGEYPGVLPWLGESLRIFEGDLIRNVLIVGAREAFHGMQSVAVRMADRVEVGTVVETGRVHNKSVAVPFADGMAEP